ncbi:hypothetical protein XELAEV_18045281mg [Xenopus laevis]|uniref:Secreted protein n=1 Tax=Xenopus laevis TaxID=8355 RepID=A0A974C0F3_XENLA|nr:hypothetical protein XELAEV_18045281mg [Xenopus laevis]
MYKFHKLCWWKLNCWPLMLSIAALKSFKILPPCVHNERTHITCICGLHMTGKAVQIIFRKTAKSYYVLYGQHQVVDMSFARQVC